MVIEIRYLRDCYANEGREYSGLRVFEPSWPYEVPEARLVGTCGRHSHKMFADTVGVSGPSNRGGGRTLIRADCDKVVLSLTGGRYDLEIATQAHLTAEVAVELAVRLIRAARDIDPEVLG